MTFATAGSLLFGKDYVFVRICMFWWGILDNNNISNNNNNNDNNTEDFYSA